MSKRLTDYSSGKGFLADGDLVLFAHPGGGYVFAVADGVDGWVAWGDSRLWVDPGDFLVGRRADIAPAAGLLIGRRFATAEKAVAAARPHKLSGAAGA